MSNHHLPQDQRMREIAIKKYKVQKNKKILLIHDGNGSTRPWTWSWPLRPRSQFTRPRVDPLTYNIWPYWTIGFRGSTHFCSFAQPLVLPSCCTKLSSLQLPISMIPSQQTTEEIVLVGIGRASTSSQTTSRRVLARARRRGDLFVAGGAATSCYTQTARWRALCPARLDSAIDSTTVCSSSTCSMMACPIRTACPSLQTYHM